jgi:hypothetical protein
MDIFFAERHTTLSTCYIATNLVKHPAPNAPPVFISTPNTLATEGNLWSYAIAADDINPGDSVTYSLQISPSGMHVTGKTVTWTPENADVGSHAITIRATDTHGAFNDQLFVVKVANVNQAPVITSPATSVAVQDQLFQYQAQASDTDAGDVLTWQLTTAPAGMTVSFTGLISWTPAPAQVGSNNIVLQVKDAANVAAQQIITITVSNVNDAPVITDPVTQIATEDIPFSLQLAATDPDGNQVFWFVIQGPDSLKVNMNTGLITWTPLQNVADSIVIVKIGAKDSALLDTMTFNISVAAVNDLPVITSVFPNTFKTDTLYSIPLTANDEEGNVITWTVAQKPATMNIISNVLVWAPSSIGSDTIVLIVSDGTSSDTLTSYFQVINGSATGISHSKYLPMPTDLSLTSIKSDGRISLRVGMPKDILSGTLNVYDIKGRIVATYHIGNNGWHTVQLPNISSGIFVARIIAGKKTLDIRIANH